MNFPTAKLFPSDHILSGELLAFCFVVTVDSLIAYGGGTAPLFCMLHKRGLRLLHSVQHTKLSGSMVPP